MIRRPIRLAMEGSQTAAKSLPKVTSTFGVVMTTRFHLP